MAADTAEQPNTQLYEGKFGSVPWGSIVIMEPSRSAWNSGRGWDGPLIKQAVSSKPSAATICSEVKYSEIISI